MLDDLGDPLAEVPFLVLSFFRFLSAPPSVTTLHLCDIWIPAILPFPIYPFGVNYFFFTFCSCVRFCSFLGQFFNKEPMRNYFSQRYLVQSYIKDLFPHPNPIQIYPNALT